MLTNEEIIERYGNRPESDGCFPHCDEAYISCDNCPVEGCSLKFKSLCDGYEIAYDRIRTYLAKTQTPDPTADVPQKDKADADILYICDRRACEVCDPNCRVTKDIRHAKNFELFGNRFVEKDNSRTTQHGIAGTMPVYCVNCGSMKLVKKHFIDGNRCDVCGMTMRPKPAPSRYTV